MLSTLQFCQRFPRVLPHPSEFGGHSLDSADVESALSPPTTSRHHSSLPPRAIPPMSSSSTTQPTILYVADPKADIVLRSNDGVDFLACRLYLEAASEVFEGMFSVASGNVGKMDSMGRPTLEIDEKAEVLDVLLRFNVRDQIRSDPLNAPHLQLAIRHVFSRFQL